LTAINSNAAARFELTEVKVSVADPPRMATDVLVHWR
jgi:hypothetical protein